MASGPPFWHALEVSTCVQIIVIVRSRLYERLRIGNTVDGLRWIDEFGMRDRLI